jgi:hypothetical protein
MVMSEAQCGAGNRTKVSFRNEWFGGSYLSSGLDVFCKETQ